jgi:hypothetical protein
MYITTICFPRLLSYGQCSSSTSCDESKILACHAMRTFPNLFAVRSKFDA